MVSVINGLSERAAFLFGGDRLMYVIGLSFSYVSVGYSSSRSRGAVHSVYLTRGAGILLCYIGPEHVLKLLRTGSIHLDSTYNVLLLSFGHMGHLSPCDYLRTGYRGFNSHSSAWRK